MGYTTRKKAALNSDSGISVAWPPLLWRGQVINNEVLIS